MKQYILKASSDIKIHFYMVFVFAVWGDNHPYSEKNIFLIVKKPEHFQ